MLVTILGTLAIVAAAVAIGVWADRRWSLLPRREALIEEGRPRLPGGDHAPGEAPATAIRGGAAAHRRAIARARCACAARLVRDPDAADDEDVRFEGEPLRVVRLRCPRCGAARPLYLAPP